MITSALLTALLTLPSTTTLASQSDSPTTARNWNQFRGPQANGIAEGTKVPESWSATQNLAWKCDLPGTGWTSPVVNNGKVYVGMAVTERQPKLKPFAEGMEDFGSGGKVPSDVYEWKVACLDLQTGRQEWIVTVAKGQPGTSTHPSNTFASETLIADGKAVYGHFASIGVAFCLDQTGKQKWERKLGTYPTSNGWGTGSSPVLFDGRLIVLNDNLKTSVLKAFDCKTGKDVWTVNRKSPIGWCSPYLWTHARGTELIVCGGAGKVESFDPKSGDLIWSLSGMQTCIATPTSDGERVYFGNNGPFTTGQLVAVKAGAKGDITPKRGASTSEGVVWRRTNSGPGIASPVLVDGRIYVVEYTGGIIGCYDAKTGERIYRERVPSLRQCAASLVAAAGKIYLLGDDGTMTILKAGQEFEIVGTNKIADNFWATPAIVGNTLLLRSANAVYCIRTGNKNEP